MRMRFAHHDPQSRAFFLEAIQRTLEDRNIDADVVTSLKQLAQRLPDACVRSGRRRGRSILYEFEVPPGPNHPSRVIHLVPGPNYRGRICLVECDTENHPLGVELTP